MQQQPRYPGAIADSSPLVHYSRIGALNLLQDIYRIVAVPDAVWKAVVEAGRFLPGSTEVAESNWIQRRISSNHRQVHALRADLDPGESEVVALALEWNASIPVILDDRRARRIAQGHGITVIGSAGLLLAAKDHHLIESVEPVLAQLKSSGLRLSDKLIQEILRAAGEL